LVIAELGGLKVGDGRPVAIMGAINLGVDSFYKGSIARGPSDVARRAREMVGEGSEIIDIGAMSTGPGSAPISLAEELRKLIPAIKAAAKEVDVPISVDTQRAEVAEAAIATGASIINDIGGLKSDARMADVISATGCSAILMAAEKYPGDVYEIADIGKALGSSLRICREHGIPMKRIAVDPAIGHWPARLAKLGPRARSKSSGRDYGLATHLDLRILAGLKEIKVGRPLCLSMSRKSFIGEVLKLPRAKDRLHGSLAAATIAVLNGAHVIRTHDPLETLQAVRMAERVRELR